MKGVETMSRCIHQEVCAHKTEDESCLNVDICKFFSGGAKKDVAVVSAKKKYTPRVKKILNEFTAKHHGDVSREDFDKAKKRIQNCKSKGTLTDNQIAALESLEGKHFKTLTEPQRQQVIDIAADTFTGDEGEVAE